MWKAVPPFVVIEKLVKIFRGMWKAVLPFVVIEKLVKNLQGYVEGSTTFCCY